jgi:hypothetical protein
MLSFGKGGPASVWVDSKSAPATAEITLELAAGVHTLVIDSELAALPDRLTLRSPDVVFRPD